MGKRILLLCVFLVLTHNISYARAEGAEMYVEVTVPGNTVNNETPVIFITIDEEPVPLGAVMAQFSADPEGSIEYVTQIIESVDEYIHKEKIIVGGANVSTTDAVTKLETEITEVIQKITEIVNSKGDCESWTKQDVEEVTSLLQDLTGLLTQLNEQLVVVQQSITEASQTTIEQTKYNAKLYFKITLATICGSIVFIVVFLHIAWKKEKK